MAIQYDKLNAAYAALRAIRQAFLDGVLSAAALEDQEAVIRADLLAILELPPA